MSDLLSDTHLSFKGYLLNTQYEPTAVLDNEVVTADKTDLTSIRICIGGRETRIGVNTVKRKRSLNKENGPFGQSGEGLCEEATLKLNVCSCETTAASVWVPAVHGPGSCSFLGSKWVLSRRSRCTVWPQLRVALSTDHSELSCEVLSPEPLVPLLSAPHPATALAPPAGLPTRVAVFSLCRPGKIWVLINHPPQ